MELTSILHILLVEDNTADARLLQEALRASALACEVSVVEDGEQALAFVRQEGPYTRVTRPDVVVLDLQLPALDGHEVLRILRATPEGKTLPVMILAGMLWETDRQQAAALGVERCLQKPGCFEEYVTLGQEIATWWRSCLPASLP
jgi:chemotaxis family two-component system response regulator Rcp1